MPFSRSSRATQTFSAAALSGLLEAGAAVGLPMPATRGAAAGIRA